MKPKVKETKKRIIISFAKLTPEQMMLFSEAYPEGYTAKLQKITKPSSEVIYVVPFETEDTIYMVKVDVKVDAKLTEEEFDKEILKASKGVEFDAPEEREEEEEEDKQGKDTFVLVHGDYSNSDINEEDDEDDDDEDEDEEK
jgi:hypothetical protein